MKSSQTRELACEVEEADDLWRGGLMGAACAYISVGMMLVCIACRVHVQAREQSETWESVSVAFEGGSCRHGLTPNDDLVKHATRSCGSPACATYSRSTAMYVL